MLPNITLCAITNLTIVSHSVAAGVDDTCRPFEYGIDYPGNDLPGMPLRNVRDEYACAAQCSAKGVQFFAFGTDKHRGQCWCKTRLANRREHSGRVNGRGS